MNDSEVRLSPHRLTAYGALLGLGMIAAAWVWAGLVLGHDLGDWFPAGQWAADMLWGGLIGAVFALAAWRLLDDVPSLKRVEESFYLTLDMPALRFGHAALFGLLAGVPEEILFRGALQPAVGVVIASLVFGGLHALNLAYFVYATGAGLLLGGLAIWREGLWAPIAAHTMIDAVMFVLLIRRWRQKDQSTLVDS
jgi:membrane protease YdiL (CAAX protease family)